MELELDVQKKSDHLKPYMEQLVLYQKSLFEQRRNERRS